MIIIDMKPYSPLKLAALTTVLYSTLAFGGPLQTPAAHSTSFASSTPYITSLVSAVSSETFPRREKSLHDLMLERGEVPQKNLNTLDYAITASQPVLEKLLQRDLSKVFGVHDSLANPAQLRLETTDVEFNRPTFESYFYSVFSYNFLYSLGLTESSGDKRAVSPKDARGLFQIMEPTWKDHSSKDYAAHAFNPKDNAIVAVKKLYHDFKHVVKEFPEYTMLSVEKQQLILAASYNLGVGRVTTYLDRLLKHGFILDDAFEFTHADLKRFPRNIRNDLWINTETTRQVNQMNKYIAIVKEANLPPTEPLIPLTDALSVD